ncbi:MAG: porin, partial [Muribaculaceae bacterium]|nr:porin [Muribaculaceae bacterium]
MKKGLCLLAMAASSMMLWAQNDIVDLKIEVRADYQREYNDGHSIEENCGFRGKYLNMAISGNINDHFSYSWRHRFNKMIGSNGSSFFDATDWVWLAYNINNFEVSAGKQVVGIGGYEYDRAPIDLYFCSEFWNNVACYQFGVSGAYSFNEGKDKLMFQFCQSPFRTINPDMYAYNLMWYGNHGIFSSIYSVNMMEYAPGRFINYISLGNKFTIDR